MEFSELAARGGEEERSEAIKARVNAARKIQQERFAGSGVTCNAKMNERQIETFCALTDDGRRLLSGVFEKLGLSARAYNKILKLSRTIADLDGGGDILPAHLSEAIRYRNLDRRIFMNA